MSENTKAVTDDSFQADVLGAKGAVLVDFWRNGAAPARRSRRRSRRSPPNTPAA